MNTKRGYGHLDTEDSYVDENGTRHYHTTAVAKADHTVGEASDNLALAELVATKAVANAVAAADHLKETTVKAAEEQKAQDDERLRLEAAANKTALATKAAAQAVSDTVAEITGINSMGDAEPAGDGADSIEGGRGSEGVGSEDLEDD